MMNADEITTDYDVVIVGGCGRAGLPLAIALADAGRSVAAFDIDGRAVGLVADGYMPFLEEGADEALQRVLDKELLTATVEPAVISQANTVVIIVGTPIDEHLNPDVDAVPNAVRGIAQYLQREQLLILRSTVYPGVTRKVEDLVARMDLDIEVAFCPERIAEGQALAELHDLPQIVASRTVTGADRAGALFGLLTERIVPLDPEEAELAKLFTNTWRYIKFATANQLYMIANEHGLDFEKIRAAIVADYPRAKDFPRAGFTAGPCLLKDTMQLAAFYTNNFTLGHAAMSINEGLPLYVISRLETQYPIEEMTVGILGMAFKAGSDDTRSSLSYKLKRILKFKAKEVLTTDPFVNSDDDLLSLAEVVREADLVIIGAPHDEYRSLQLDQPVIDVWNIRGRGTRV